MDYVSYIRQKVGNAPLFLSGTGVVIWKEDALGRRNYLIQKRKGVETFGILGGALEIEIDEANSILRIETYLECSIREVYEESGIKLSPKDLREFKNYSGPIHVSTYPNGDCVIHGTCVYTAHYEGEVSEEYQNDETTELVWMTADQLADLLTNHPERFFINNIPILWDVIKEFD